MPVSRRRVLQIVGGGVIVAAGVGYFAATRTPRRAQAPWRQAGIAYADPRLEALSWAILAPNPHNRQPWLVRLEGDDAFTLLADPDRRLPETDPFDRQITIGLGCFLEIARQAAAARRRSLRIVPFPEGESEQGLDGRPVARATVAEGGGEPDPLFAHVLARRSCKEPFDLARSVPDDAIATLAGAVGPGVSFGATTQAAEVAALRDLGWRAHVVESETPRTYMESVRLMRIGRREIERNPDGIDLGGPLLDALHLAGLLTRDRLADTGSDAYRQGMDLYRTLFEQTPAFAWLTTAGNARRDQLAAGAAWVRLNLAAAAAGLALHPVSQALQEYPEMAPLLAGAHERLGAPPGARVQMLGRLGYGPETPPSPRWPLETRILPA